MRSALGHVAAVYLIAFCVTEVAAAPEISSGTLMSKHSALEEDLDNAPRVETKRAAPRTYSFGLGKKSDDAFGPQDSEEWLDDVLSEDDLDKRADPMRYSFGIGKKAAGPESRYSFGIGKKAAGPESRYSFGIGKRAQPRYAFGLGKRPMLRYGPGKKAANRFAFGLGKRDFMDSGESDDFMKRRYSFGLGKRAQARTYSFGLGRR